MKNEDSQKERVQSSKRKDEQKRLRLAGLQMLSARPTAVADGAQVSAAQHSTALYCREGELSCENFQLRSPLGSFSRLVCWGSLEP